MALREKRNLTAASLSIMPNKRPKFKSSKKDCDAAAGDDDSDYVDDTDIKCFDDAIDLTGIDDNNNDDDNDDTQINEILDLNSLYESVRTSEELFNAFKELFQKIKKSENPLLNKDVGMIMKYILSKNVFDFNYNDDNDQKEENDKFI